MKTNFIIGIIAIVVALVVLAIINTRIVLTPINSPTNLTFGLATWAVSYLVIYLLMERGYHSLLLGPLRRDIQFLLSSIIIDKWDVDIVINANRDAKISHDFMGRINFGRNRWIRLGIQADADQMNGLTIKVINVDTDRQVEPKLVINYPRYKRLRIYFDRVLTRGDRFHYRVEYYLKKTFSFGGEDYYLHSAVHYEKRLAFNVSFPDEVVVERAWSEIITDQGDYWERHDQPVFGPNSIRWTVERARLGNRHRLRWVTRVKEAKD